MIRIFFMAFLTLLALAWGFAISCNSGDDDDSGSSGDHSADDDDSGDDSAGDVDDNDDCGYVDEGGSWIDSTTGLEWQLTSPYDGEPPEMDSLNWSEAVTFCENLCLDGKNDWRLPTISELRSLIRGCPDTETGGACGVTDDCLSHDECHDDQACLGCGGGSDAECRVPDAFDERMCALYDSAYWSSSSVSDYEDEAWILYFNTVGVGTTGKTDRVYGDVDTAVKCVR